MESLLGIAIPQLFLAGIAGVCIPEAVAGVLVYSVAECERVGMWEIVLVGLYMLAVGVRAEDCCTIAC